MSGGAWDGEHSDTSPFPGYTCANKAKYFRIFLPFNRTNYENSLFNGFISSIYITGSIIKKMTNNFFHHLWIVI